MRGLERPPFGLGLVGGVLDIVIRRTGGVDVFAFKPIIEGKRHTTQDDNRSGQSADNHQRQRGDVIYRVDFMAAAKVKPVAKSCKKQSNSHKTAL